MSSAGAAIKVGATALLVAVLGYVGFKFVSKGVQGESGYEVYALFKDASGLVDKSRVQIAGLTVGEIRNRRLQGNQARVTLKIRSETELWSNAAIYKKSASLLGEFYLEIDPGTAESIDPVSGQSHPNFHVNGCKEATGNPDCNQIHNVIEAITTADLMAQMNETLPVLRDILRDVQKITAGPMQDVAKEVQEDIRTNSAAAEKLLGHIDGIVQDLRGVTNGPAMDDLRKSMDNVKDITESVKGLVGSGQGQMDSTGEKIKRDLDQLAVTLDKVNKTLDTASGVVDNVSKGQGTVGKLLTDDTIARNVTDMTDDVSSLVRSLTRLQTLVGIREEIHVGFSPTTAAYFKTYLTLKLMPKPDKYYLIELVDDPRGHPTIDHTYTSTNDPRETANVSTDTFTRSSAFRVSFMFAKRIEPIAGLGITGRLGIKETTGGLGLDFDMWKQRLQINLDLFDFSSEDLPRLKVLVAVEVFRHAWLVAGGDDLLNSGPGQQYANVGCGPISPQSWCSGGREVFGGAQLSFNDEDLKALLAAAGSALSGAGGK